MLSINVDCHQVAISTSNCFAAMQVAFNSPAPEPTPQLPPSLLKAFTATNVTGFDNYTLLSANASDATNTSSTAAPGGTAPLNSTQQLIETELLSLTVQPDYLVPLKVVAGISSSFLANAVRAEREVGEELTGTEVLK